MSRKNYIVFMVIVILIPIIIWFVYFIGYVSGGIPTTLLAGDLLLYIGSILTAVATIVAVIMTINHNKSEIDRQFKREMLKAHDEKLFNEICIMAKDIMIYLSLPEFLSSLNSVLKSMDAQKLSGESRDAACVVVDNTRRELMALDKVQWYYHEVLDSEDFFSMDSEDSRKIKEYFRYIHDLLLAVDEKLKESSDFRGISPYYDFFLEVDKQRLDYQYEVTEKTAALIKCMKNIISKKLQREWL